MTIAAAMVTAMALMPAEPSRDGCGVMPILIVHMGIGMQWPVTG
jgi:hypothetical protein